MVLDPISEHQEKVNQASAERDIKANKDRNEILLSKALDECGSLRAQLSAIDKEMVRVKKENRELRRLLKLPHDKH